MDPKATHMLLDVLQNPSVLEAIEAQDLKVDWKTLFEIVAPGCNILVPRPPSNSKEEKQNWGAELSRET